MSKKPDPKRCLDHPGADPLLGDEEMASALDRPDHLISCVRTLRQDGDLQGAADLLRQAMALGSGNAEIRSLLSRTQLELRRQDEDRAWVALMSEARARFEDHVDRKEISEADAVLTEIEGLTGAIEELKDLRVRLPALYREEEEAELASLLSQAERLRDDGRLREAVDRARQVLVLDPQNCEAATLVDALISETSERDFEASVRRDVAHIDALLQRGRLWRAELMIRRSRREHQELSVLRDRYQRCQRLRIVRWARRSARVKDLGRSVPVEWIRAVPSSGIRVATRLMSRGWAHTRHTTGALAGWIRLRIKDRSKAWVRALIAAVCLVVLATAGVYLANARSQREPEVADLPDLAIEGEAPALDLGPDSTVAFPGDLIVDALPWGRVVAIVDEEGEQQDLGENLFTPVRFSLPAGSYQVVLENPTAEEPAEFWVQVTPAQVRTKIHDFASFDADAYFEKAW